jgi:hypothetical protein
MHITLVSPAICQIVIVNSGEDEATWQTGTFVAGFGQGVFAAKQSGEVDATKEVSERKTHNIDCGIGGAGNPQI